MKEYISLDAHKHYSLMERQNADSLMAHQRRIDHQRGAIFQALHDCSKGTAVAVEATGNWYWIVEEIEQAGLRPLLVHPRKAKLMMGLTNKTDKLDVHGLNTLQRNGTLPTVWIPPAGLRDLRELTRVRMIMARQRTRLKNRISSTLSKYALHLTDVSDAYAKKVRPQLLERIAALPPQTRWASETMLAQLDFIERQILQQEKRVKELLQVTPTMKLLMSLPGIGLILAAVLVLEIGTIERFASAAHLASYAGTTPRVHASGGKVRYGHLRSDVNRYLKWAYAEAGNSVAVNHQRWPRCARRHVSCLYGRVRSRKGHATAIGAVARHLAESTYWIWVKNEPYRDPVLKQG